MSVVNVNGRRPLTPREREVVGLVTGGMKNREVAKRLKLSVKTIETHRSNVMNKLALGNITDLVRYALREGLTNM